MAGSKQHHTNIKLYSHAELQTQHHRRRIGVATWNLLAFCNEHSKVAVPARMELLRARLRAASSWADVLLLQEVDRDLFASWVAFFDELGFDGECQGEKKCTNTFFCATFWRRAVYSRQASASGSRTLATVLTPVENDMDRSVLIVGNVHLQAKSGEKNVGVRAAQITNLLNRMNSLAAAVPSTSASQRSRRSIASVIAGDFNSNIKEEAATLLVQDGFSNAYDGHQVISYNVGVWEGHIDFLFVEGAQVQALLNPGREVGPSAENPSDHLMHGLLIEC